MLTIPSHHRFTTTHPIDNVPAGATGLLKRLDKYHIALIFDDYEDLVFDVNDTDLPKLSSIQALQCCAHVRARSRWAIAASLTISFIVGWLSISQPQAAAAAATYLIESVSLLEGVYLF